MCGGLLVVVAIGLGVWSLASSQERSVSYSVRGALAGVSLDVGAGDVEVVGGGRAPAVAVSHVDRFGFGHGPSMSRAVVDGTLQGRLALPEDDPARLLGAATGVIVPDNVPVAIDTTSGSVRPARLPRLGADRDARAATSTSRASAGSRCRRAPRAAANVTPRRPARRRS